MGLDNVLGDVRDESLVGNGKGTNPSPSTIRTGVTSVECLTFKETKQSCIRDVHPSLSGAVLGWLGMRPQQPERCSGAAGLQPSEQGSGFNVVLFL